MLKIFTPSKEVKIIEIHSFQVDLYLDSFDFFENEAYIVLFSGKLYGAPVDNQAATFLHKFLNNELINKPIGSFSAWVFNKKENTFLVFRDPIGVQPIYYMCISDKLIFSQQLRILIAKKENLELNEDFLFLNFTEIFPASTTKTLYKNIWKLAPNTCVTFNDFQIIKSVVLYNFKKRAYEFNGTFEEAVKAFRSLWETVLLEYIEPDKPIFSQYSGGVDSTGLVGYFHKNRTEPLHTYLLGLTETQKEVGYADDQHVVQILLEDDGIPLPKIITQEQLKDYEDELCELDIRDLSTASSSFLEKTCLDIQSKEGRFLLSGFGGDECLTYNQPPLYLLDTLKHLKIQHFIQGVHTFGFKTILRLLISQMPILIKLSNVLIKGRKIEATFKLPKELSFQSKDKNIDIFNINSDIAALLTDPSKSSRIEHEKEFACQYGIEMRYPFYDLRLIEFFMSLKSAHKIYQKRGRFFFTTAISKWVTSARWHLLPKSKVPTIPSLSIKKSKVHFNYDASKLISELPEEFQLRLKPIKDFMSTNSFSQIINEEYIKRLLFVKTIYQKFNEKNDFKS